jgi:hypothetical protein
VVFLSGVGGTRRAAPPSASRGAGHSASNNHGDSSKDRNLETVVFRWRVRASHSRTPPTTDLREVYLHGDWDPSQVIKMHLVDSTLAPLPPSLASPSGSQQPTYAVAVKLPPGTYRYYFTVDGRPELTPDQPIENSRNMIVVTSPSESGGNSAVPRAQTPSASVPLRASSPASYQERSKPLDTTSTRSPSMMVEGTPGQAISIPSSSSVPTTYHHVGSTPLSSSFNVGSLPMGMSPTPNTQSMMQAAAAARLFSSAANVDPFADDDSWGQEIPDLPDPDASSRVSPGQSPSFSPNARRPSTGAGPSSPTKPSRLLAPVELPPHLERALLNSQPVADDPSMLPLPHHVMLNHLYERRSLSNHIILGLTQRYREKFVTVVFYKPMSSASSTSSPPSSPTSTHR